MPISLLDPGDRNVLRSKSVVYFQERFPRYDKLNFSLIGNTLVIQISNIQDLPVLIKACPKLLARASTSIGVAKIAIRLLKAIVFEYSLSHHATLEFNQQASIIKEGLERMSQAVATPTQENQEKTILRAETENGVTNTSFTDNGDELISITEITARTGIPEAGLSQYINLDGIKVYKLRGEILLPSGAIRPAIEGFYAWEASMKSSEALNLLVQQEIRISNESNASTSTTSTTTSTTSTDKKQVKGARASSNKPRAKYKLANDFKVSNSYGKTIASITEAQGKKSLECLQDIASSSVDGTAIIKKAALKYKNPEKAEKGLMQAAVELVNSQSQISQ